MSASPAYAGAERRRAGPSPLWLSLTALVAGGIAYATLCPIELRPHLASANLERFVAFFGLGAVAGRAGGRRALLAAVGVALLAFALEGAQMLSPTRHAHLEDALVKAMGGLLGAAAVQLVYPIQRRLRSAAAAAAVAREAPLA